MHIEKNVPITKARVGSGRPAKYPFRDMEVGDSLFAEGQNAQGRLTIAARGWARTHNAKFVARTVEGGCRVWRIE